MLDLQEFGRRHELDFVAMFGSHARGAGRAGSDLDLAVMGPDSLARDPGLGSVLSRELERGDLDLVWMNTASWLMWLEVARDGVVLYEKSPGRFASFCLQARLRSWDAEIWRRRDDRFIRGFLEGTRRVNEALVRRKLAMLAQYLGELRPIVAIEEARFLDEPMVHHAAERLVELLVECAAAINTEASQSVAGIPPADYYSSFFSMASTGWVARDVLESLADWARMRNALVHRYEEIALKDLYQALQNCLPAWESYVSALSGRI